MSEGQILQHGIGSVCLEQVGYRRDWADATEKHERILSPEDPPAFCVIKLAGSKY